MNQFDEIIDRLDSNQNMAYSLIRIFLGVSLLVRGWILVSDPGAITELVAEDKLHMWYSYITIGHLLGGLSLALGFFTRFGAMFQIPILVGAVFIAHEHGLMMGGQSLELAALVLFLLNVYLFFGSGPISLDQYFRGKKSEVQSENEVVRVQA